MTTTLYDRINVILGRDCPASGGVSAEAIGVIRELESRIEGANQLFQDICDCTDMDSEANILAREGTYVADSVADYKTKS